MVIKCTRKQGLVVDTISSLAHSNGYYCRLWNWLYNAMKNNEDLTDFWAQFDGCKNKVDVVMVLEG